MQMNLENLVLFWQESITHNYSEFYKMLPNLVLMEPRRKSLSIYKIAGFLAGQK